MEKSKLRKAVKLEAAGLTEEYRAMADGQILTRLLLHPMFQEIDSIFCYVNTEGEPATREILETAWQMNKLVTVPRCIPGPERRMEAVEIHSFDDLKPGTMGILEPVDGLPVVDAYKISMAIVPCVAADRFGGRLGHGAGYYDRFLHGQSMYTFCLCYEKLLQREIPMEATDVRMQYVVTEDKIYRGTKDGVGIKEQLRDEDEMKGLLGKIRRLFS